VEVHAESGSTAQNIERLWSSELDVAFVHTPFENADDLGRAEIATEPLVVGLPSGHPLSRRRRVRAQQLTGVPLVYVPRRSSPGVYDSILTQVYDSMTPDTVRTEPTMERVLVAVAEGAGLTVLLEERAAMLRRPGVTFRRFADPEPTVALAVAFRQPPPLAARRFVELAQELGRQPRLAHRPRL